MVPSTPDVSVLVVARNEAQYLAACIGSILDQTLDPDRYEVLYIDSMSTDGSRAVVDHLQAESSGRRIKVFSNPRRLLATGWNIGIQNSQGKFVVRPDAHACVAPDFLERNLEVAERHPEAWAVGGAMEAVGEGFWGKIIASCLSSRIGVGNSSFRVGAAPGPSDTVVFGLYRKERLLEVGGIDENVELNQDNVLHAKMHGRGAVLWYDPSIRSVYFCRPSLLKLFRQMFRRGIWLMLITRCGVKGVLQPRHVTPLFVLLLAMSLVALGWFWGPAWGVLAALATVYCVTGWLVGRRWSLSWRQRLCVPLVLAVLHGAYGLGEFVGVMWLPFRRTRRVTG